MLLDELRTLPKSSGVYQYFDEKNRLLYVGKAKNLFNRVKSYFNFTPTLSPSSNLSPRIYKMISETKHLEYIVTSSEADALILENSFIKQLKPKYNILLRDDKTYPYIFIDLNEDFPRFEITRKIVQGANIKYFGPFFSGSKDLLEAIYINFRLIQKKSCLKSKKKCLFYQMQRCYAPCENEISKEDYKKIVDEALISLQNPSLMIPKLTNLMQIYANSQNYEQAAAIRDQINSIKNLEVKIEVDIAKLEDFEVFCVTKYLDLFCGIRFSIQKGKIVGVKSDITNAKDGENNEINEIYKHFILDNFAINQPVTTTKIYTFDEFEDMDLVAEILNKRHNKKFSIKQPKVGEKRKICEIAQKNAQITIQKHIKTNDMGFLNELKEYFSLSHIPNTIECFDNSHLFGEATVAGMIRYENGNFAKEKYRHFHLENKNDYDQMRESLTIRALRFNKLSPPDLWIIDGGEALLNLAVEILKSSGTNIDVIAISKEKIDAKAHRAKGKAKDKIYTINNKFNLATDDKKLLFFQKMRDEAHRFAISFHRKIKSKQDTQNSKLAKLGISKGSITKLVNFYGSFDKIYKSSYDDIKRITNKSVADKIFKEKS
ncbi:UvrABC nucleotide excision repair complex, subunit UvrC [Campylobacter pinnipediorum subsp. pinnipediorum]|uniref:excinuclease ABC subunit UvrC n=1 Tax=Campylobacter pinnipediorum TaxID=1965231 RepID=UPI000994B5E4|nr:excinuclease ABC subunit UvrC [Campylobacter pinnipediorum]AQW84267.1 UvrABC nucleotide excision repair complex, subunit UvrC [Campylobacter pinnipediorum subsp. pinnipediorum]